MMKKVMYTAAVLVSVSGLISMASCSKSYTCECSYDDAGTRETVATPLGGYTRVDAKASCDVMEVSLSSSGYSDVSCSLK